MAMTHRQHGVPKTTFQTSSVAYPPILADDSNVRNPTLFLVLSIVPPPGQDILRTWAAVARATRLATVLRADRSAIFIQLDVGM